MNTTNKVVIQIVQEYIKKDYENINRWLGYTIEEYSYSKWAAKEVLNQLLINIDTPPIIVLGIFMDKMEVYSKINFKNSSIFQIAYKTAESFIDMLL